MRSENKLFLVLSSKQFWGEAAVWWFQTVASKSDRPELKLCLSLNNCVTLGKSLSLSEPYFLHLLDGISVVPSLKGPQAGLSKIVCTG